MAEHLTIEQRKKLMINYLPQSVDAEGLRHMFMQYGDVANAHIVKNTQTNESKGYGFITYHDCESSAKAIQSLNGKQMEDKRLRVAYTTPIDDNLRTTGSAATTDDVNVYIANMPKTWDEKELSSRFKEFGPLKHCKILRDGSGASRGAGFVRYENSKMAAAAILNMDDRCPDGATVPLVVKIADGKKKDRSASISATPAAGNHSGLPGLVLNHSAATANALQSIGAPSHNISHTSAHRFSPYTKPASHGSSSTYTHPGAYPPVGSNVYNTPSNNAVLSQSSTPVPGYQPPIHHQQSHHAHHMMPGFTPPPAKAQYYCIYIGNLPETTCKSCLLYQLFSPYGAIANVKPMTNVNPEAGTDHWFAFVNFKNYSDAVSAIQALNGSSLNGRSLKVDFKTEKKK